MELFVVFALYSTVFTAGGIAVMVWGISKKIAPRGVRPHPRHRHRGSEGTARIAIGLCVASLGVAIGYIYYAFRTGSLFPHH